MVKWKIFQTSIVLFFLFGDIYFEWHLGGLAAGFMGGMLAYYLTKIILAVRGDLPAFQPPDYSARAPSLSLREWHSSKHQAPQKISD